MTRKLEESDYLELWMFFQGQADAVKEAMFSSVTWVVGFSAALLGFIFTSVVDVHLKLLADPPIVIGVSAIGLALSLYSALLIRESRKHIVRNWRRARYCEEKIVGLFDLIQKGEDKSLDAARSEHAQQCRWYHRLWNRTFGKVWWQIGFVVGVLGLIFAIVLASAF